MNPTYYKIYLPTPTQTYAVEIWTLNAPVNKALMLGWVELNKKYDLSEIPEMAMVCIRQAGVKADVPPVQVPVCVLNAAIEQETINHMEPTPFEPCVIEVDNE